MNFSIILPSRERPGLLAQLLDSLKTNTEDIKNIEVIIALDEDDKTDYSFLENYKFVTAFRVRRSLNFSKDYYNFLAQKSSGRWIICMNDDGRFETDGWDDLVLGILDNCSNVIYGHTQDGMDGFRVKHYEPYCSFPLVGRGGYEALGYIFPPRIPIWGANIWTKYLYEQVGSVVKLPIMIKHYCPYNKTRERDHISDRITRHQGNYVHPESTEQEFQKVSEALVRFNKVQV